MPKLSLKKICATSYRSLFELNDLFFTFNV